MIDYTDIFNSDYFVANMINVMSAQQLYFYQQTTKYIYNNINLSMINNKIIGQVCDKLKVIFKDKYDEFIELLQKRKMIIHGSFINQIIWDEQQDDGINIRMISNDIGNVDDNVFIDYQNIDNLVTYDPVKKYREIYNYLNYEPDTNVILNNQISLYISDCNDYPIYPVIFRNSMTINNHKFELKITDVKSVMYKKELLDLNNISDEYYGDESCGCEELIKLSAKYNFSCACLPLDHNINYCYKTPIIVCKDNHFTMLNNSFFSTKENMVSCDLITVNGIGGVDLLYVDITQDFTKSCHVDDCPFNALQTQIPIEHFHSCIFLKRADKKFVMASIVLKYQNNKLFSKHDKIFNSSPKEHIDGNLLKHVRLYKFPPPPIGPGCFGLNINYYKKIFNHNFDEGEFAI